jgi:hypothetical protein
MKSAHTLLLPEEANPGGSGIPVDFGFECGGLFKSMTHCGGGGGDTISVTASLDGRVKSGGGEMDVNVGVGVGALAKTPATNFERHQTSELQPHQIITPAPGTPAPPNIIF